MYACFGGCIVNCAISFTTVGVIYWYSLIIVVCVSLGEVPGTVPVSLTVETHC